ncbi:MAG: creatininase family protein [Rhodospirillales bacterium]|nr:creatininase family protein [Rhodospirillales bacterium]
MFETVMDKTLDRWFAIATPNERVFGLYLFAAFVMAILSWAYFHFIAKAAKPENSEKSVWGYIFDKKAYFHRSAYQDYKFFLVNGLIYVGLISQLLISTHLFMSVFYGSFNGVFGAHEGGLIDSSVWTILLYTLIYALFLDFAIFITHLAQHKVPLLWEFHKVHHSAEVLNPLTLYRMHPVDLFFSGLIASMLAGLAFAGYYYLTGETPHAYEVMGLNIFVFAFYLFGYNLRHSQIWLSYPVWLSHILISPAQHQIHHSADPRHWDKNMGLIFAFWDKMFKTLYVPRGYEKLTYGISRKEPNPFCSVADMYLQPFKRAWKLLCPEKDSNKALVALGALVFIAVNYGVFYNFDQKVRAENGPLPSVYMEDLTWTEIQQAMDERGYDTVIIPTGGTEQNGAHVVLGKHNYVVHYAAGEIARRRGDTLVAPVISYVPEDVHMGYAGTVSLPEPLFESVLKAAAQSYKAHGFKNILFIGDSGGNQAGQANAAEALSENWAKDGVKVAQIDAYYSGNGQMDWLLEQGRSKQEIGGHAGIRDTSEMLFIHPEGVRRFPWYVEGRDTGHNGDYSLARRRTGERMIDMKIDAALAQINEILGTEAEGKVSLDKAMSGTSYMEP